MKGIAIIAAIIIFPIGIGYWCYCRNDAADDNRCSPNEFVSKENHHEDESFNIDDDDRDHVIWGSTYRNFNKQLRKTLSPPPTTDLNKQNNGRHPDIDGYGNTAYGKENSDDEIEEMYKDNSPRMDGP